MGYEQRAYMRGSFANFSDKASLQFAVYDITTSSPCSDSLHFIQQLTYQQAMAAPPRCAIAPLPRCAAPPPRCAAPLPRCAVPLPRCVAASITATPELPPRIVSPRPRCGILSPTWPRSMLPPLAPPLGPSNFTL